MKCKHSEVCPRCKEKEWAKERERLKKWSATLQNMYPSVQENKDLRNE